MRLNRRVSCLCCDVLLLRSQGRPCFFCLRTFLTSLASAASKKYAIALRWVSCIGWKLSLTRLIASVWLDGSEQRNLPAASSSDELAQQALVEHSPSMHTSSWFDECLVCAWWLLDELRHCNLYTLTGLTSAWRVAGKCCRCRARSTLSKQDIMHYNLRPFNERWERTRPAHHLRLTPDVLFSARNQNY